MKNIIFVTSNERKLLEFQMYIPDLSANKGMDLPEVLGTMDEVAIHKALMAGDGHMIEDTILIVDGEEVVDIRWKLNDLPDGSNVTWITTVATNSDGFIKLFRGEVSGVIDWSKYVAEDTFGYDSIFVPHGIDKSLHELGLDNDYNARKKAIQSYLRNDSVVTVKVDDIEEWNGDWQQHA